MVLQNKEAIKAACHDEEFEIIAQSSSSAEKFGAIAVGPGQIMFWKRLAAVLQLLQAVRDAIHQLEGDQAVLSQILPVWLQLAKHSTAWHATQTDAQLKEDNVVEVLASRRDKSMHDAALVAYVLDPIHFRPSSSSRGNNHDWSTPAADLTASQEKRAKQVLYRLCGTSSDTEKKAIQREWSEFNLGPLPDELTADLPFLTERQKEGKRVVIKPMRQRLGWWNNPAHKRFPRLARGARRLLPRHVTSCAAERNWSQWGLLFSKLRNRMALDRAAKLIFIAGNKGCLQPSNAEHAVVLSLLEDEDVLE